MPATTSRGSVLRARRLVGACIHVTKTSATEWRIQTPVSGALQTHQIEWRFQSNQVTPVSAFGHVWELLGLYARDLAAPGDVQLSSSDDGSVYEYAWVVGIKNAPQAGFDFQGNGHGGEQLGAAIAFVLDGVDISNFSIGTTQDGLSLVVTQTKTFQLPRNADGTSNLVTEIGTGTTVHTFDVNGCKVNHTHTFAAGYEGYTCYAAMMPNNFANLNRVAVNGGSAYTPTGDSTVHFTGTQITTVTAWHATAHHYRLTMSLPSGGPSVPSDWSNAGPDYGFFDDLSARGKTYVLYVNDTYATRKELSTLGVAGTITCEQQYAVSYV